MDPVPAVPPGFPIVQLSGPLLLANLFHWGLFGVLSVQVYMYYQAFPKDPLSTKSLVYGVYIILLVETVLLTHDAFARFGYGFSNLVALISTDLGWLDVPIMSGLISFIGQSFYAYRLHVISKSRWIPLLIVVMSLTSTIGAIFTGIFTLQAINLAHVNGRKNSVAAGVWCGASASSDIIIAVCMTYFLSKMDTGYRQTRVLISKITRLTIETGSLTALVAVIVLVLLFGFPGRTYYGTAAAVMPGLYSNCILVVLNVRCRIEGSRPTYFSSADHASGFLRFGERAGANDSHVVAIHREVLSERDSENVEMKGMGTSSLGSTRF
ncbi:hypothetical protein DFH08DRAFT_1073194 [Mycena albidolilacea]|uniref:DUF6534 domain-containing protein n=1 Tax=Mycena albidolilacea TaxID=1033008 RepID=A0AAD7F1Q9_9AGAR|nr:hypothetical protein DFH08DRAFT_1073194 [Mycena albidolilacea]